MKTRPANLLAAASAVLLMTLSGCGKKLPLSVDYGQGYQRTVLVEVFTSEFCTNCPKADAAAEQISAEMGDSMCLIEFHPVTFQSSGDSLGIGATDTLVTAYEAAFNAKGLPLLVCDGVEKILGTAADVPGTYALYRPVIDVRKQKRSPVRIILSAQADQNAVQYTATMTADALVPSSANFGLVIVLVEDSVNAYGKHNRRVARSVTPNTKGEPVNLASLATTTKSGSIATRAGLLPYRLSLVAFIRDNTTKEVLQAAKVRVVAASTAPAVPVLNAPAEAASGIGLNPSLSWYPSNGAASYTLHLATDSVFNSMVVAISGLTGTSQTLVNGLANSATYFWRVNASNNAGVSAWSAGRSFTTTATLRPGPPALRAPANGDTGVSKSPLMVWGVSSGASSYALQIATDLSFNSGSIFYSQAGLTDTIRSILGLSPAITYYWRVSAANGAGSSQWSGTWSFTTTANPAPETPHLVAPANGATTAGTNPMLSWDPSSGAASYSLQVSAASTFSSLVRSQSGLTGTSQAVAGLPPLTTYYWRVNASNTNGTSGWSDIWSFTDAQGFTFSRLTTIDSALPTPDTIINYSLANPLTAITFHIYVTNLTATSISISGQSDTRSSSDPTLFWGQLCTESQCVGPGGVGTENIAAGSTRHWMIHYTLYADPPPVGLHYLTIALWDDANPGTKMSRKLYLNVTP